MMPATLQKDKSKNLSTATSATAGVTTGDTARTPRSSDGAVPRLDALTSLRFFAALMIFIGHATALTPPNRPNYTEGLALWQGVSFFFVLSGFILAYVYPRIDSIADAGKFLLARFARIWPTHLVAFLVTLLLVPQCLQIPNALPSAIINLCLLQVWTLDPTLASSFNKVSWTISVELFFYTCFPFLIKDFAKPFKTRWITLATIALSFVLLCLIPCFPGCAGYRFAEPIYIGFNPLCRLAEFILGIALCRAFTQGQVLKNVSIGVATLLEVLALTFAAIAIYSPTLWPPVQTNDALFIIRSCALDIGGAPAYGALILLMASEKGYISRLLTKKLFVGLGEISFSLYMFHLSVIFFLVKYQPSFGNQVDWLFPCVAFVLCLCISHLNFVLIETPCRQAIMSLVKRKPTTELKRAKPFKQPQIAADTRVDERGERLTNFWTHAVSSSPFKFSTAAEIGLVCLLILWVQTQYRFIPQALAARVETHSVPALRGVDFSDKFQLRGLKLTRQGKGVQVNAVWQSLVAQRLTYINAVQLIDAKGKILSSHDYLQDAFQHKASAGQIWEDKLFLNASQLKDVAKIGLSIFQPSDREPLTANRGPTDWNGRRLLISLE